LSLAFRSQNHQGLKFKSTSYQYPHQVHTQKPAYKMNTNDKSTKSSAKGKNTDRDFSTLSPIIKCYNCQGYEHVAANCSTQFKIAIIDRIFIEVFKPDSTISPKITPVIKEFSLVLFTRLPRLLSLLLLLQLSFAFSLSQLYYRHHLLRFHYCRPLLSLSALIVNLCLLCCRHSPM